MWPLPAAQPDSLAAVWCWSEPRLGQGVLLGVEWEPIKAPSGPGTAVAEEACGRPGLFSSQLGYTHFFSISLLSSLLHAATLCLSRMPEGGTLARLTSCSLPLWRRSFPFCPMPRSGVHHCKWGDSVVSGWESGLCGRILMQPLPGYETSNKSFNSFVPQFPH